MKLFNYFEKYLIERLIIGKIINYTIGSDFGEIIKLRRNFGLNEWSMGAKNEIGIHSNRLSGIVSEHTILYTGSGEHIEFNYQAHSQNCLVSGAIAAIKFITEAKEKKIYTTQEVIKL